MGNLEPIVDTKLYGSFTLSLSWIPLNVVSLLHYEVCTCIVYLKAENAEKKATLREIEAIVAKVRTSRGN